MAKVEFLNPKLRFLSIWKKCKKKIKIFTQRRRKIEQIFFFQFSTILVPKFKLFEDSYFSQFLISTILAWKFKLFDHSIIYSKQKISWKKIFDYNNFSAKIQIFVLIIRKSNLLILWQQNEFCHSVLSDEFPLSKNSKFFFHNKFIIRHG